MAIQTLCVGICRLHEQYRICVGCYRSRLEIKQWLTASDAEKEAIISSVAQKTAIYGDLNGPS